MLKQDYGLDADDFHQPWQTEGYGGPSQFENKTRIKQVSKQNRGGKTPPTYAVTDSGFVSQDSWLHL